MGAAPPQPLPPIYNTMTKERSLQTKKPRQRSVQQRKTKKIERAEMYIANKLPEYVAALEELALGVKVIGENKEGEPVVYIKEPDRQAAVYLVDRVMGKAQQQITGEGGGPIEIVAITFPDEDKVVDAEEVTVLE